MKGYFLTALVSDPFAWLFHFQASVLCSLRTTNSVQYDLSVLQLCSSNVHWPNGFSVVWLYIDSTRLVCSSFTGPKQFLSVSSEFTLHDAPLSSWKQTGFFPTSIVAYRRFGNLFATIDFTSKAGSKSTVKMSLSSTYLRCEVEPVCLVLQTEAPWLSLW